MTKFSLILLVFFLMQNISFAITEQSAEVLAQTEYRSGKPKVLFEHFEKDDHYKLTNWDSAGNKTTSEWKNGLPFKLHIQTIVRGKKLQLTYSVARKGSTRFDLEKVKAYQRPLSTFTFDEKQTIQYFQDREIHITAHRNKGRQFTQVSRIEIPIESESSNQSK